MGKKKVDRELFYRSATFLSVSYFFIDRLLFYRSTTFFSPGNFLVGRLLFYPFGLFFIHLPSFISNPLLLYLPTCAFYHSCSFITKTTHVLCWYELVTWCVHTVNSFGERAMWRGGLDFERRVDLVNFEEWIGWIFFLFCLNCAVWRVYKSTWICIHGNLAGNGGCLNFLRCAEAVLTCVGVKTTRKWGVVLWIFFFDFWKMSFECILEYWNGNWNLGFIMICKI